MTVTYEVFHFVMCAALNAVLACWVGSVVQRLLPQVVIYAAISAMLYLLTGL